MFMCSCAQLQYAVDHVDHVQRIYVARTRHLLSPHIQVERSLNLRRVTKHLVVPLVVSHDVTQRLDEVRLIFGHPDDPRPFVDANSALDELQAHFA